MKFGKLPAKEDPLGRTLRFSALLAPQLPEPPPRFSVLPRVQHGAGNSSIAKLFPMDGNARYGDCVVAGAAHAETVWEAMCGKRRVPASSKVISTYFQLTGGPDSGLVMLDTLNVWRQKGLLGEKILAYVAVSRTREHIEQAMSTFGCLYIGFRTTTQTLRQFRRGEPWTPGEFDGFGHCVVVTGYDEGGVTALTWGATARGTWGWLDSCVDEIYCVMPGEATLSAFAPGLNLAALRSALESVTA